MLLSMVVFFFSLFHIARADVLINEIAWKGTPVASTHEWIELTNVGESVDISGWTIKDGINQLNIVIPDGTTISDGGFYVIKRSTSDISPFDFSTVFNGGLSDGGEKLILADSAGIIKQTLDFSSGWPDATMTSQNTMQWNGSSWISSTPTPGVVNPTSSFQNSSNGSNSDSTNDAVTNVADASGGSSVASNEVQVSSIKTKIKTKNVAFINLPLTFEVKSYGKNGEELSFGKYFWNFGDGITEERFNNTNFTHTFHYAGEYLVSVEYFSNYYSSTPDVFNKIKIKVVPVELSISRTGDAADFFVEISNNSTYDIDLSAWKLASLNKIFLFPKNTNILAKNKIILSPLVTSFTIEDKNNLKLYTPNDKIIFPTTESQVIEIKDTSGSLVQDVVRVENKGPEISAENLVASATNAPIFTENSQKFEEKTSNSPLYLIIFLTFLSFSGGAVYFIRRNNVNFQTTSDFEILDE